MPSVYIKVELPRARLLEENYIDDDYLLNQMDKINDSPEEDGLPLRKWILRETHEAIVKNPKLTEVSLKPKADKRSNNHYEVTITE